MCEVSDIIPISQNTTSMAGPQALKKQNKFTRVWSKKGSVHWVATRHVDILLKNGYSTGTTNTKVSFKTKDLFLDLLDSFKSPSLY